MLSKPKFGIEKSFGPMPHDLPSEEWGKERKRRAQLKTKLRKQMEGRGFMMQEIASRTEAEAIMATLPKPKTWYVYEYSTLRMSEIGF